MLIQIKFLANTSRKEDLGTILVGKSGLIQLSTGAKLFINDRLCAKLFY